MAFIYRSLCRTSIIFLWRPPSFVYVPKKCPWFSAGFVSKDIGQVKISLFYRWRQMQQQQQQPQQGGRSNAASFFHSPPHFTAFCRISPQTTARRP